jgi:hypothetical protein
MRAAAGVKVACTNRATERPAANSIAAEADTLGRAQPRHSINPEQAPTAANGTPSTSPPGW